MRTIPETGEPVPDWLVSKIRRAAFFSTLGWSVGLGSAALLLAGVAMLIVLGEAESPWIPAFWCAVFLGVIGLLGYEAWKVFRYLLRPELSPELAYLRRSGLLVDVANGIVAELEDPGNARFGGEATVTRSWLVFDGGGRFGARRLEDLVKAFPKTETMKLNHVVPVWRFRYVVVESASGPEAEAKCSKGEGLRLLEHLASRCPRLEVGAEVER